MRSSASHQVLVLLPVCVLSMEAGVGIASLGELSIFSLLFPQANPHKVQLHRSLIVLHGLLVPSVEVESDLSAP